MKLNINLGDLLYTYKKQFILVGIVVVLGILGVYLMQPTKDYATKLIEDMVKRQSEQISKENDEKIAIAEAAINSLRDNQRESDKKISLINNKIKGVENEISNNKPPESTEELYNQFRILGFPPLE